MNPSECCNKNLPKSTASLTCDTDSFDFIRNINMYHMLKYQMTDTVFLFYSQARLVYTCYARPLFSLSRSSQHE